jgi:hypothetical protein
MNDSIEIKVSRIPGIREIVCERKFSYLSTAARPMYEAKRFTQLSRASRRHRLELTPTAKVRVLGPSQAAT